MKKTNKNPSKKVNSAYVFNAISVPKFETTTSVEDPTTISTITTTHFARR